MKDESKKGEFLISSFNLHPSAFISDMDEFGQRNRRSLFLAIGRFKPAAGFFPGIDIRGWLGARVLSRPEKSPDPKGDQQPHKQEEQHQCQNQRRIRRQQFAAARIGLRKDPQRWNKIKLRYKRHNQKKPHEVQDHRDD